jgi:hypothetical protein
METRKLGRISRWLSLRWRIKARYWRRRAILAERELKAEMWRNRAREDELITVPQRMQGLFGIPAREAPAPLVRNVSRPTSQLVKSTDPWDSLSWADRQEFDMYWKDDAAAAGVPLMQARERFLAEVVIPRRQPLMDDVIG